jgi:hypothetical protein
VANVTRPDEKLDENVARQLASQAVANRGVLVADLLAQGRIEPPRLVRQHDQMHERIGVDDEEQDRREEEEGEQRQFDVEERQLDRILQEKVGMRHRARCDRKIE